MHHHRPAQPPLAAGVLLAQKVAVTGPVPHELARPGNLETLSGPAVRLRLHLHRQAPLSPWQIPLLRPGPRRPRPAPGARLRSVLIPVADLRGSPRRLPSAAAPG